MKIVRFLTLAAAMTMTIVPHSTYAQAGGSHEQLEQMFANISQKTSWDMSKKMLLGYYFANPTREPLELASRELSEMGYWIAKIFLANKKLPTDMDLWWLHVERVEVHSVNSLFTRNAKLTALAERHRLAAYDGMDVGPVDGAPARN